MRNDKTSFSPAAIVYLFLFFFYIKNSSTTHAQYELKLNTTLCPSGQKGQNGSYNCPFKKTKLNSNNL